MPWYCSLLLLLLLCGNCACKYLEIYQVPCCYCMHHTPVDFPVIMHGDIAESHGLFQLHREVAGYQAGTGKFIEALSHGVRRWHPKARHNMGADVDTQLNRPRQIQHDDVLRIRIHCQRLRIGWAAGSYPPQATPQRFQFLLNHFPIHAILRSASILLR